MTFRKRLVVSLSLSVVVTVAAVTWTVAVTTRRAFERLDNERTSALVAQFRREFARRGEEVVRRAEGIAAAESALRVAVEMSRPEPDLAAHVNTASELAAAHGLDFLELVNHEGAIVSSAQWPARFGYKAEWTAQPPAGAFLKTEELPNEAALALAAVRAVRAGDKPLYIVAGRRIDSDFLASLVLPAGMRALLHHNAALVSATGPVRDPQSLAPLIEHVRAERREAARTIEWPDGPETFQAIPLTGRDGELLAVLLVGSSRRELAALVARIRSAGILIGGAGVLLGLVLTYWVSKRLTGPVEELARGAREVAGGNWDAKVEADSGDELGELARAFNHMTRQLLEQRDRLVQSERVAAWRELARRLAHELKNPLFPLQITIENLKRAKELAPDQFDEVFRESAATLLSELANMKTIIGRFSDFAKMPAPHLEPVDVNDTVRKAVRLFEAQFQTAGRPIEPELALGEAVGVMHADPEQLTRALQNLMLNAIDAMPRGGRLAVRTAREGGAVILEVADTGEGLTREECGRLFTPYYTTKQHGTGLGLAIVQSIVADHRGRISVESERGRGTTFRIELPAGFDKV